MSHLQADPKTFGGQSTSASGEHPIVPPAGWLVRLLDPEYLAFEAFLLVPALLCLLWGDWARAEFYGRLALYLGCVKWLGSIVLAGNSDPRPVRFVRFPIELIAGITIAVVWFYIRNVVGWLVPGSYGLGELGILSWLVAAAHLLGPLVNRSSIAPFVNWRQAGRPLLRRACVYGPFTLTLGLTLWSVAKEIFVPSLDSWFHAFIARVYLNDGLFYPHFNGGQPIIYASGFGAINAVTAALSGLSIVKVQNLQHVLWVVVGLYAITATVALVAGRLLAAVHVLPLLFLSMYPVHNLPPEVSWEHAPQQLAAALLMTIPIMSLLLPPRRDVFYTGVAIQSALSLIVLAMNPVSAPFVLLSCTAALVINCYRGRVLFGERPFKVASVHAGLTVLAALLVLGSDRFYSRLILSQGEAGYMTGSHYGGDGAAGAEGLLSFSPTQGISAIAGTNPFGLIGWPAEESHVQGRHLAWLVVALTACACGLAARKRAAPAPARYLAGIAAASLIGWLAAKYGMTFITGGITVPGPDSDLFDAYLLFFGRRVELWLLFLAILTAGASVYLGTGDRRERAIAGAALAWAVIVLAAWWLPLASTHLDPRRNHVIARNMGAFGRISADDLELAQWMESNLTPDKGLIGLTSMPFKFSSTGLLLPMGAAQALPLYGKGYNFCFQLWDPGRTYSYDEYTEHVVNYLDVDWCLKNNIRYFHVPKGDVSPNHGLSRALEIGLLQPVRTTSTSGVYEVRPMLWTPRVVSIPPTPDGSYHVRWLADGTGVSEGEDPQLVFTLKKPEFVHAIRLKYTLTNPGGVPAAAQLFWKQGDQPFVEHERTARMRLEPHAEEETLTILVHDTLDQFRFDPDAMLCTFRIREVELLIRPPEGQN